MFSLKGLFSHKPTTLNSPCKGELVALDKIPDDTFKKEILGPTVGIEPQEGLIFAPCDGTLSHVINTKHAVTILAKDGAQILVHVGIDTVKLKGEFFESLVGNNVQVKQGQPLIKFDNEAIKAKGFSTLVTMVVCNAKNFKAVEKSGNLGNVDNTQVIFTITANA